MHEYTWAVEYDDGSVYTEDQLGGFAKVDLDRVRRLHVIPRDEGTQYVVVIADGARPIFFRRTRTIQINDPTAALPDYYENNAGTKAVFATCFGWQKTVNGVNVKSMTWIMYDGSVAVTDQDIDHVV